MTKVSCIILPQTEARRDTLPNVGGKANSLAIAHQHGFSVPRYFVVLPPESRSLALEDLSLSTHEQAEVQILLEAQFSEVLYFAVRSSACAEDGSQHSFAGMLESYLFVAPHQVAEKISEVRQSARTSRVIAYCKEKGLQPDDIIPSVIVQEMVNAEKSGVAFGADPVSGSRNLYMVSATWGLGSGLVSGECESDTYYIIKEGQIVQQEIARKTRYHLKQNNAMNEAIVTSVPVTEEKQQQAVLSEQEALQIADFVDRANAVFQGPQDIEWCIQEGQLYLLQSRPITNLPSPPPSQMDCWHEWDNGITYEAWPGVNTPLTYSLANRVLTAYVRDVLHYTSAANIEPYQHLTPYITGHLHGAIYLDTKVWDSIFSVSSSGQQFARELKAFLKNPLYNPETRLGFCGALKSIAQKGFNTFCGVFRRFFSYSQLPLWATQLEDRVDALFELDSSHAPWQKTQAILNVLDNHWYAAAVNSTFLYQVWEKLKQLNPGMTVMSDTGYSQSAQLSHQFMSQLKDLSGLVSQTPGLMESFALEPLENIQKNLDDSPEVKEVLEKFLSQFGDRCEEDAKLESIPWSDNPLPLLRIVGVMAQTASCQKEQRQFASSPLQPLPSTLLKKLIYQWHAGEYQKFLIRRERLRLQFTRLIGLLRRNVQEVGQELSQHQVLEAPDDILFLSLNEITTLMSGSIQCASAQVTNKEMIQHRKADYQEYLAIPPLPDKFKAWGTLLPHVFDHNSVEMNLETQTMIGQGCSPGQVSGEIVWYSSQQDYTAYVGKILAAHCGDPSLVHVYPLISGLLLERGSVLSHPAIVARELNLPTIVSLPGLSLWLMNGDSIMMDGTTGYLKKKMSNFNGAT